VRRENRPRVSFFSTGEFAQQDAGEDQGTAQELLGAENFTSVKIAEQSGKTGSVASNKATLSAPVKRCAQLWLKKASAVAKTEVMANAQRTAGVQLMLFPPKPPQIPKLQRETTPTWISVRSWAFIVLLASLTARI